MSREDHPQAFIAFVAGLLGDFDRYLAGRSRPSVHDLAAYRVAGMWLSDTEYAEVPARTHPGAPAARWPTRPAPGRTRRASSAASLLPGSDPAPEEGLALRLAKSSKIVQGIRHSGLLGGELKDARAAEGGIIPGCHVAQFRRQAHY